MKLWGLVSRQAFFVISSSSRIGLQDPFYDDSTLSNIQIQAAWSNALWMHWTSPAAKSLSIWLKKAGKIFIDKSLASDGYAKLI